MSTSKLRSSFLMSAGNYTKELEDLKKLLQKTTEEMKACCANQLALDQKCKEAEQNCQEILDDVKEGLFETSRGLEEGAIKHQTFGVIELGQIVEENNREFLASIREAQEDRTQLEGGTRG